MAVPSPAAPPPSTGTTSTFRIHTLPNGSQSTPSATNAHLPARPARHAGVATPSNGSDAAQNAQNAIPLSARKATPLDLNTVERRGAPNAPREIPKSNRLFGLQEAPTYRPTEEQWKDPVEYMKTIKDEASRYGIAKIIPPDSWKPEFAIDTERFHFRTRRQELNSIEGGTRANLNYMDQLQKYHSQFGGNYQGKFPSVDKRPLDMYKLKKAVEVRGGFDKVCKGKKWAEIGRDLGYSGKIMSSLSTSLKKSYERWLLPYEEYLKLAKPGVQQMIEAENGGPYTPSPSPMKKASSHQGTPNTVGGESPAIRASTALNATLQNGHTPSTDPPKPQVTSGFTPVNSGFTAVNAQPSPSPAAGSSSFSAVNGPHYGHRDGDTGHSTPLRSVDSPRTSAKNTPDLQPSVLGATPLSNGQAFTHLKRQLSNHGDSGPNGDSDSSGRRSKRIKKENAPTVAGSHMTQPRIQTPRFFTPRDRSKEKPGDVSNCPGERTGDRSCTNSMKVCETCGKDTNPQSILLCDACDSGYHMSCLQPPLKEMPSLDWYCPKCLVGTGEYGFEEGGIYSLKQFQDKASSFRESHFASKLPFDPILNRPRALTEDDVEREFWRLVESKEETVEVEYGADIHSTTHGSGFPTIERNPRDAYATDPWNLNILPFNPQSLFRYIKTNISGMTVPWLYVGMIFSTFCWHAEDHNTYSANYQHFGATKTWYGIPGEDAAKFENAMREAVPELFETQPDLLFQLVTLLTPEQLKRAGVRVYALDQRAGQLVVTFPQAYHAGFNHGFNFNEAVNFAPTDWEPFGEIGALRLQEFRRQPCFSHDELLLTASGQKDITIKTAKWLGPALQRMFDREKQAREDFISRHIAARGPPHAADSACRIKLENSCAYAERPEPNEFAVCSTTLDEEDKSEDEILCTFCKAYGYLSRYVCKETGKVMCLLHAGTFECCPRTERERLGGTDRSHEYVVRIYTKDLEAVVEKIAEKGRIPEAWQEKRDALLADEPTPSLKSLRSLLAEGEKISWPLEGLSEFRKYVERCNAWVEKAQGFITRRQQNRRKNEKAWRKSTVTRMMEDERREEEYRKLENITKLLEEAEALSFDCPEITTLRERADSIAEFRQNARAAIANYTTRPIQELDDLCDLGRAFNVDIPEIGKLDLLVNQLKWYEEAQQKRSAPQTMPDIVEFIEWGETLEIPQMDEQLQFFKEEKRQGELWNEKALELLAMEPVHYQQLDALSKQASSVPVNMETLALIDEKLKKQRDAQQQVQSLYERSQLPDLRQRPMYKEIRETLSSLEELNLKPQGAMDLEKEQKRQEDWMRKGKKLFGKANAPLHILLAHMKTVEDKNKACFDISDQPRMPVEPSSRANTPDENADNVDGSNSSRDVFCICRRPEAGMMIECELCHEWYHGKCLKIARGKVKEDDKYTCPICDHRMKIPRDASRPKLEDLQAWADEIPGLPFQPEEEQVLESIITHGQNFRDYVKQYINPMMSNPDELTTQRFYLRKLEGADILLAPEINFFRQEVHKWAPVAPEPPPMIEMSLSTRKPRPTKQQKIMAQLGITNPDDLPPEYKSKNQQKKQQQQMKEKPTEKQHSGDQPRPENPGSTDDGSHTPPGTPPATGNTSSYFDALGLAPGSGNPTATSGEAYHNTFATTSPTNLFASSASIPASSAAAQAPHVQPTLFGPNIDQHSPAASPPPSFGPSGTAVPLDPAMFVESPPGTGAVNFGSSAGSAGGGMGFLDGLDMAAEGGGEDDATAGGDGFGEAMEAMGEVARDTQEGEGVGEGEGAGEGSDPLNVDDFIQGSQE